jgi:DNA polymerase
MSARDDIAAHLRVFADMGINGLSRDRAWRSRERELRTSNLELRTEHASSLSRGELRTAEPSTAPDFEVQSSKFEVDEAPSPSNVPAAEGLQSLKARIGVCTRCPLHAQGRTQVVFGVGNPNAKLMFVGEAPGGDEDRQGEPFVGAAGQLLTKIIEAIDLKRGDVYIANVIKCRPPGNRNPEPVEVATCKPFLLQQIDIIRPKVIVALGTFAAHALLEIDTPISRLRGRPHEFRGGITLVPTFHPAFLLRSPERKRDVWEDMKKVRALLAESD